MENEVIFSISIHAPSQERQYHRVHQFHSNAISIHAPSQERPTTLVSVDVKAYFNPRSLAGATIARIVVAAITHISIHAPSQERPIFGISQTAARDISIHAPSQERHFQRYQTYDCNNFNPRSLAGATSATSSDNISSLFQSTLPRRSD